MRKLVLIIGVLFLVSCGSTKKGSSEDSNKYVVEDLAEYNAREIKQHYPEAQVKEGSGMFEEGTVERPYTILFPNTADEIHITWKDENRSEVHEIYFSGNGKWHSKVGLEIGMSYDKLNQMNAREVLFYGFGWDYSGAVLWNDGKFEDTNLRVFLAPEKKDHEEKFYGDHIIRADEKEIQDLDLRVQSIIYKN